jgi:hypothetical protein
MKLNIKDIVKDTLNVIKYLNDNSVLNDILNNINEELKPEYSLSYSTIYDKYEFNLNYNSKENSKLNQTIDKYNLPSVNYTIKSEIYQSEYIEKIKTSQNIEVIKGFVNRLYVEFNLRTYLKD